MLVRIGLRMLPCMAMLVALLLRGDATSGSISTDGAVAVAVARSSAPSSPPAPPKRIGCDLKPGCDPAYRKLCWGKTTQVGCAELNATCVWVPYIPPPPPPPPCSGHGARSGDPPTCHCDAGYIGEACSTELPCGDHPGQCVLKAGQPPAYKPVCTQSSASKAACDQASVTCAWVPSTPSGRPCASEFSSKDLTGLWTGQGALSKAMFWAQANTGTYQYTYHIQCLTGNYTDLQAGVSLGSGYTQSQSKTSRGSPFSKWCQANILI